MLDLPLTLWREDATPTLVVFDEFQDLLVARQDLDGLLRSKIQYHGDAADRLTNQGHLVRAPRGGALVDPTTRLANARRDRHRRRARHLVVS